MFKPLTRIRFQIYDEEPMYDGVADEYNMMIGIVIAGSTGPVEPYDAYKYAIYVEEEEYEEDEPRIINIFDDVFSRIESIDEMSLEEAFTHEAKILRLVAKAIYEGRDPLEVFDELEEDDDGLIIN